MNRSKDCDNPQEDVLKHKQKHQNSSSISTATNDVFMKIDPRLVGLVVGKNAAVMRRLTSESGAFIAIINDSDGSKRVQIRGNRISKKIAIKLINNIIANHQQNKAQSNEVMPNKRVVLSMSNLGWNEVIEKQKEYFKNKLPTLPPIIKNFYQEQPEVSMMTNQEIENFKLSKNNIMVKHIDENNTEPIPKPVLSFSHAFKNYPEILEQIKKQNFETPSPIQCQVWPIAMSGYDLIAIAQPGTGKTLAYLLPAFIHLDLQPTPRSERKGPSVLVLAPTIELVVQIENEVNKYSYKGINVMSIYKGDFLSKRKCLQESVDIVIATPDWLNLYNSAIDLLDVTFLILYEADRMLDLEFEIQMHYAILKVRPDRQTIMTSATWSSGVERLASSYTTNPIQVIIGSLDLTSVNTVKQQILVMKESDKEDWLDNFLSNMSTDDKVIVFMNRKVDVDILSTNLSLKGLKVNFIHGDRKQYDREQALDSLRNGDISILIATDETSRGIDVNGVTVINYDFTLDIKEYVHRICRIGRAGKAGLAITLMTKKNWAKAKELVEVLEKSRQVTPDELQDMVKQFEAYQERKKAAGRGNKRFRRGGDGGSGSGK